MTAIGSLRVELELQDGSFTTRIIRAGTSLNILERQVGQTIVAVRRLDSGFATAGAAVRDFTLTLGLARAALENIYSVFGQWAVSILQTSGEIQRLTTLLEGMSKATDAVQRLAEGREATKWILELGQRAPFAVNALSAAFVKLNAGGISQTNDMMLALVDAVARFGGSSTTLDRAATAIQQMAGKGVISMEELRQQLGEAVPEALPMLARSLGTTVDQLVQKISDGRVRAEPALAALRREFALTFGGSAQRLMETFNGQVEVLRSNFQRLQLAAGGISEGGQVLQGGFLATTIEALKRLNEGFQSPEMRGFAVGVGLALTDLVKAIEGAIDFFVRFREEITATVKVLGGLMILRMAHSLILTLGTALNALTLGFAAKTASVVLANASIVAYATSIRVLIPLLAALPAALTTGLVASSASVAGLAAALTAIVSGPLAAVLRGVGLLPAAFTTATLAASAFVAVLRGTAFAAIAASLAGITTAMAGVTAAGATIGAVSVAWAAAMAFGLSKLVDFGSGLRAVGNGAETVTDSLTGMVGRVSSLGTSITSISSTVGVLVANLSEYGLQLGRVLADGVSGVVGRIGNAVDDIYNRISRYFSDPNGDYRRAQFGAADDSTIKGLESDVEKLRGIARQTRDAMAQIAAARGSGPGGRIMANDTVSLPYIQGHGLTETLQGGWVAGRNIAEETARLARMQEDAQTRLAERQNALRLARIAQNEQLGRVEAQREIAGVERDTTIIRAAYENRARDIQQSIERAYAARNERDDNGNFIMSPEELGARIDQLREFGVRNAVDAAKDIVSAWEERLNQFVERSDIGGLLEQQRQAMVNRANLMTRFNQSSSETERATLTTQIQAADEQIEQLSARLVRINAITTALQAETDKARRLAREVSQGTGLEDTLTDAGTDATRLRQAETLLNNLKTRAAEINGEITGLGSNLGRINQLLASGRYGNIGNLANDLRNAAIAADTAEAAMKTFRDAQRASERIDLGVERATADLNRYRDALEDDSLPDAQRNFINFQREMFRALQQVADQSGDMSNAYFEAAQKVTQALNMARAAADLGTIDDYLKAGERAAVRAADRGAARLTEQTKVLERRRDQALAANADAVRRGEADRTAQITASHNSQLAAAQADARRAGEGGARRQENDITRLTARLAELRAETAGYGGEEAKVLAILARRQQVNTAYGQQMVALARQVDEATEANERAQQSWNALRETQRQGRDAVARMTELQALFNNPNANDSSRQLLAARAKAQAAITDLQAQGVAIDVLNRERAASDASLRQIGQALAMQEGVQMRRQAREISQNLAETLSERRRIALENVEIERRQQQDLIDLLEQGSERRRQLEDNLANYIAQRRAQALRETEGPLDRMAREWGDRYANMESLAASSLDRLTDAFVDFAEKGKFSISDLATWFAKELLRMELRAQASSLLKSLGGGGGIASMIGNLFSGTGGSYGSGPSVADASGGGYLFHDGGVVGKTWAPIEFPASIWDNAPRFHGGTYLKSNEVAAVLERGEAVFTAEQTAAIGRLNHSYSMVEEAVGRIASAVSMPDEARPRAAPSYIANTPSQPSAGPVTVNIINRTDQPMEATASQPRFDMEGMVIDVVVAAVQRPGRMRDAIKGIN